MADRAVVCTFNLWETSRWEERKASLKRFLELHSPDLLCVQELRPESLALVKEALPGHDHVLDPFPGWTGEGNIFWNRSRFRPLSHGAEEIGMREPGRRLFWVLLQPASGAPVTVATAHFTWPGHPLEAESGVNARMGQARLALEALDRLAPAPRPLLFMGDFNDHYHPVRILAKGGLGDCFTGLGRNPKATRPAAPTYSGPEETLDWILYRGALRPMTAEAVDFFLGDFAPSDHKPVLSTFALG